jgi:prepilin-type processing-associated H-X9-DG protein
MRRPSLPLAAVGALLLAGCDATPVAPGADLLLPTQSIGQHAPSAEVAPLSDHQDPALLSAVVESPTQEVRVAVEEGEPFQARSELHFQVAADGTARGRGRLVAPNPTAVEYIILLAAIDPVEGLLRFEGTGVAQEQPHGREQTGQITGSIQLPAASDHPGGANFLFADGAVTFLADQNLSWSFRATVVLVR